MRSQRPFLTGAAVMLLLTLAAAAGHTAGAQENRQGTTRPAGQPPVVSLEASAETISLCPGDSSRDTARIGLRATARGPEGRTLNYRWRVTGGTIEGDGANPTWNLSGVRPGVYTATVEVSDAVDPECMAFTSAPVVVTECAPARVVCPNISIYCPDTVAVGSPLVFTAEVSGGPANITPTFNWKVSAGRITGGQGTSSITVETAGLGGMPVTATVEVMGYNLNCTATCTTQVPAATVARRFDEYGNIRLNDEKARLDNFAVQLQNEPGARGYIIAYDGRRGRVGDAARRATRAQDYLVNERGISADRVVTLQGGPRDQLTVELWIVPTGAPAPRPTP
ncbi:MAG: hypothetical protein ACRD68_16175 [Pyrinomonadaceae bacterium]